MPTETEEQDARNREIIRKLREEFAPLTEALDSGIEPALIYSLLKPDEET